MATFSVAVSPLSCAAPAYSTDPCIGLLHLPAEQVRARGAGAWSPSYFEYYSDSLASICVVGLKGCSEGQWDPSITYPLALTCGPSSG